MKGLILAGGSGTRLRPLTHTGPKQLIPIANRPNILYCLDDMRDAGITEIGVILGDNQPEKVRELLKDGGDFGVRISYVVQGAPRGIAHAIGCAEEFLRGGPFCVYLGDNLLKGGIKRMVAEFAASDADAGIALCRVSEPQRFGVAELDAQGQVVRLVEKPKEPKSDLALVGIYLLRDNIFPIIRSLKPSWRNELEITDALEALRAQGGRVLAHIVTGWWKDTGKPEDILDANRLILDELQPRIEGTVEDGAEIKGRVAIGPGSVVRRGAVIHGPAIIGRDCEIGPGTYIGPYTTVGDRTVIEVADIENSILLADVHLATRHKIVGSLIGSHSHITEDEQARPRGMRVILGEHSHVRL
jgi:glucose-1-phosphate thymidylyltransferase